MKRTIISIMAAVAIFAGCDKKNTEPNQGNGTLVLKSITTDGGLNDVNVNTKALPSEMNVDLADFDIIISNKLESGFNQTYKYSEIKENAIALPTGTYTLTAKSPEGSSAAWDQPLFYGTEDFAVVAGAVSPVTVKCSLSNAVVSIKCTPTFLNELSTFDVKVSGTDRNFLTWTADNIDADGYFSSSELNIQIDGERSIDGSTASIATAIKNVRAKDHIILNLDARVTGEVQEIVLTIDGSVNDRNETIFVDGFEEIDIPDPTEPENPDNPDNPDDPDADAPKLVWAANPTFAVTEIQETMNVNMQIIAPNKIATCVIDVDSPTINSILAGMTSDESTTLDIINDAKLLPALQETAPNLPTGDKLLGKTSVDFPLSDLIPLIYKYENLTGQPNKNSNHYFTLKVSDEKGKTFEQKLTFHYSGE